MQYYATFQGFFMFNTLVKDTQLLTTHILQLQTKYLKHALIIQCNIKSQGFFMSNMSVMDTKPLTIHISLVSACNPKPLSALWMDQWLCSSEQGFIISICSLRFKQSCYLLRITFSPLIQDLWLSNLRLAHKESTIIPQ